MVDPIVLSSLVTPENTRLGTLSRLGMLGSVENK